MFFTEAMRSSFVLIVWSCLCKQIFKVRQTFSIMFRSGLCAGHDSVGIWLSLFHWVVLAETWHGALSSCKVQGCVGKCFATTGHKHWSKTLIYFSEFTFLCTNQFTHSFVCNASPKHDWQYGLTASVAILAQTLRHKSFLWTPPNINFLIFPNHNLCLIWKNYPRPMFSDIPMIFCPTKCSSLSPVDRSDRNRLCDDSPFKTSTM